MSDQAVSDQVGTEQQAVLAGVTELLPVLVFIGIGVLFWRMGKKTRLNIADRDVIDAAGLAIDEATD